jgi:hypothetical protein
MLLSKVWESGCYVAGAVPAFAGIKSKDPIFIVGTGRCGTSLLVRIFQSHNQLITFPGEANHLWHPNSYPYSRRSVGTPPILEDPKRFSAISIEHWLRKHEKRIQNTLTGYHWIKGSSKIHIVKSAMIVFLIPKILSVFPASKFLHLYRSGPSVVESLVGKEWEKYCNYFGSLSGFRMGCAKYWNDCILEIERQKTVLSLDKKGILLEFSYETLCENPRGTLNAIANFLEVKPEGFQYDLSQITSRNYKAGDFDHDEKWADPLKVMSAGMQLKGYAQ